MADFNSSLPVRTETAGDISISIASGKVVSGSFASGSIASGAIASGAVASGAFASGSVSSGAFASGALASGSIAAGAIAAGATSIADNEDVASADGDRGVKVLAVQKATPANTAGTDGDYEFFQISAGRLWTSSNVDKINGVTPLMGAGNTGTGSLRVTIATDQATIPVSFSSRTDAGGVNTYGTKASLAAASATTTEIQYTVAGSGTSAKFALKGFSASASGKIKVRVLAGTTAGILTADKGTYFTSTANPSIAVTFPQQFEIPTTSTGIVRIEITNLDTASMDVYGTIFGAEI